ncbi:hypothetical protein BVG79_00910 [Ketogulonicigenium robustum]|uniref:Uncharacterized protein n=1 Tax=Ketogulonicigenium robustum TaxID=92947 RepID=A0A1W6NYE9_9RHOB|nr:hypothetical protein BVG79_00910 [Ketogulonicigenium robustum]
MGAPFSTKTPPSVAARALLGAVSMGCSVLDGGLKVKRAARATGGEPQTKTAPPVNGRRRKIRNDP